MSDGARLDEARCINTSLSALGNVIAALADPRAAHVPYRDSKVTKLLTDALGGNSHTALIATIGPMRANAGETLSTLLFAQRCMDVATRATINARVDYRELSAELQRALISAEHEHKLREAMLQAKYENRLRELGARAEAGDLGDALIENGIDHRQARLQHPHLVEFCYRMLNFSCCCVLHFCAVSFCELIM